MKSDDILSVLAQMPTDGFRERLLREVLTNRRTAMLATGIREGFQVVTPYLAVADLERLATFLKTAFQAEETLRHGNHIELRIGDSMLMLGGGPGGNVRGGAFHLYVDNCDTTHARAVAAGAESTGAPADQAYQERSGFVKDFVGNHWFIATREGSALLQEGARTIVPYAHPASARGFITFLERAFGAEPLALYEHDGRVVHAAARVGDSVIEMGEPHGDATFPPSMFFMYVDDCDAVYHQALAAGATSRDAPRDLPYGRTAIVVDPFGNEWVPTSIATLVNR